MSTVKIHEQQKEWALKVGVGVAACLCLYFTMIHPLFYEIVTLKRGILDAQKRLELYKEIRGLEEGLDKIERVFATVTERSQLLGRISDIAGQNQIDIGTLTPRTEPYGGYVRLRMEMDARGSFFSLLKFLQAIEKVGAAIKVRDISILWSPSAPHQKGKNLLQLQLSFETLLKQRVKKNNG